MRSVEFLFMSVASPHSGSCVYVNCQIFQALMKTLAARTGERPKLLRQRGRRVQLEHVRQAVLGLLLHQMPFVH